MTRFKLRKRPVEVDAVLYDGVHVEELREFVGEENFSRTEDGEVQVWNSEERQWLDVPNGHYVIRGVKGEVYPCSSEVCVATYEWVDE